MNITSEIKTKIENAVGDKIISSDSLSGGCISDAYKLSSSSGKNFFLKMNSSSAADMFLKEAHGLMELNKPGIIKVPEVILAESTFILTEFIAQGSKSKSFFENFGRRFAQMHKYKGKEFGFYEDNYIGSNVQINKPSGSGSHDWVQFYFSNRLLFQYQLAEKNGYADNELREGISSLEKRIHKILDGSEESPSLLHGDLWGGNYMISENGEACLIDPAVYYGHREADLAMTKLFGGFNNEFYKAYNEEYPLPEGYEYREGIYKLYHVLNHLNLFGRGYYSQAVSIINSYTR